VYDIDALEEYPFAILNIVVLKAQYRPLLLDIAEVVRDPPPPPPPVFNTQLGNGLHEPFEEHVTFKLPPILV
ncbi:unnamed protein product, partial [Rotaria magnacalcarata]